MKHTIIDTFTGPFALIQLDDGSARTMWLTGETASLLADSNHDDRLMPDLTRRLQRYFDGDDVDFSDVGLPDGGGFFQRCWAACRMIPRGKTASYGELAARAGSRDAARAVGQAMRSNPLPIIVPCHRVVASSGRLHGFAGSSDADGRELRTKAALLEMEGALNRAESLYIQVV